MTATATSSGELLRSLYRTMLTIRRFEETALELRTQEVAQGSMHLCAGQEAVPAGALSVLGADDRVVSTYRGHGWAIACGAPLDALLAEICQRATGINGGRGGSAYLTAPQYRFVGENSIVGGGVPIAAGVALALKRLHRDGVAVVSIGDGATNQGATHEGLVMAVAQRLPVVFVCENNGWSISVPLQKQMAVCSVADRAASYGMPGQSVDGTDPVAVFDSVNAAVQQARAGDGPSLIEARVVRLAPHSSDDDDSRYRSPAERAAATRRDPLPRFARRLRRLGILDPGTDAELQDRARQQVDVALAAAEASSEPTADSALDHLYAPAALTGV
jgi:2-oxoisovalerate dehydrogenase E1 component